MEKHYIIELSLESESPLLNDIVYKLKFVIINSIVKYLTHFYFNKDIIKVKDIIIKEITNEENKINSTTTK